MNPADQSQRSRPGRGRGYNKGEKKHTNKAAFLSEQRSGRCHVIIPRHLVALINTVTIENVTRCALTSCRKRSGLNVCVLVLKKKVISTCKIL